jgi:hypothetical protein
VNGLAGRGTWANMSSLLAIFDTYCFMTVPAPFFAGRAAHGFRHYPQRSALHEA